MSKESGEKPKGKKEAKEEVFGAAAIKPPGYDRSWLEAFSYFLYDPENGAILTRTPLSWLQILAYYTVFYCSLALFWFICFSVFKAISLPEAGEGPKYKGDDSRIGVFPGLSVVPGNPKIFLKQSDQNRVVTDPTDGGDGNLNVDYARTIEAFLKFYNDPKAEKYKEFNLMSSLGKDCATFPFGYVSARYNVKPCVYLKLNRIWDWKPSDERPVKVGCKGKNEYDKKALQGLRFWPVTRELPAMYFPFRGNKTGYQAPLVAMQMDSNQIDPNKWIVVQCSAGYEDEDDKAYTEFKIIFKNSEYDENEN